MSIRHAELQQQVHSFVRVNYIVAVRFTTKQGPAQRNDFYYPILVFYAESDSVNNSHLPVEKLVNPAVFPK